MTPDSEAEKAAREFANKWRKESHEKIWKGLAKGELLIDSYSDKIAEAFSAGQAHERERIIAWWREKTKDEFWTARDLLQEFLKEQAE